MENKSSISLGGTILLALFAQKILFGKNTPLHEKGIKKIQNKPMETT